MINLISLKLFQHDYLNALNLINQLVAHPDHSILKFYLPNIYATLGHIYTTFECYQEAEKSYFEASARTTNAIAKANHWNFIGNCRFDAGLYNQAIEAYEEAIKLEPSKKDSLTSCIVQARKLTNEQSNFNLHNKLTLDHYPQPVKRYIAASELAEDLPDNNITVDNVTYLKPANKDEILIKGKRYKLILEDKSWYLIDLVSDNKKLANSEKVFNFVVLNQGTSVNPRYEIRAGKIGHFLLANEGNVLFAGGICFKQGKIIHWNNCTEHYKTRAFMVDDIVKKVQLPKDKFFPREQLQARIDKIFKSCNENWKQAATKTLLVY